MRFSYRCFPIAFLITLCLPCLLAAAQEVGPERNREAETAPQNPQAKVLPPGTRPNGDYWRLGIIDEPLDVGTRIRDVSPRSPAERAGLERDDIIIGVNGYQIGRVGNVYYPIEVELQRQANERGEVRLLVQDHRTARLMNIDVRLDRVTSRPREAVVRGEIFLRERIAIPPGAELRLELQRRTTFSRDTIARVTFPDIGQPPVGFELRYPIDRIRPNENYDLRAEIWHHGRRLYVSDGRYPIRPGFDETGIRILMRRD